MIDLASGTLCQYTDGCMDDIDIARHYQKLCDLEGPQQNMEKRLIRHIADQINRDWVSSGTMPSASSLCPHCRSSVNSSGTKLVFRPWKF